MLWDQLSRSKRDALWEYGNTHWKKYEIDMYMHILDYLLRVYTLDTVICALNLHIYATSLCIYKEADHPTFR